VRAWNAAKRCFEESLVTRYRRVDHVWTQEQQVPVDQVAEEVLATHPPEAVPPKTGI
jgi:hypothetical protein